ncbi:hypothetical protein SAMN05444414_14211 [Roseovarius marisflavi]|uniref:Uncharacterized protein n=1 Tax=Roseovarius marisflavi TaxID=1054996 RepID=A0A1M7DJK4_9RHOB|nr:hypothetical protein [Roseovarius marisflavi]SHL79533.1 hypothetical protein SAMN05444414_14211 [Roseovarius marisflavi]
MPGRLIAPAGLAPLFAGLFLWHAPQGHRAGDIVTKLLNACLLLFAGKLGYLSGVLKAIAGGHKQTDINLLLPWNYVNPV